MTDLPVFENVELDRQGQVAILTLSRPKSLNSLSLGLIDDIHAALDAIEAWRPRVRALIITGAGRAFCSGGDISAHPEREKDAEPVDLENALRRYFNPLLFRLLNLRLPFVNAVNGPAAGAGCPLALCADIVIAGKSARFESGFTRIGLMPDLGLTWLLPLLVGRARAHAMMILEERVSAERAAEWGMVYETVADDRLLERALEIAGQLSKSSVPALVTTRKAILRAMGTGLEQTLDSEAEQQRALGYSGDFKEGIEAFFEKRKPLFSDY